MENEVLIHTTTPIYKYSIVNEPFETTSFLVCTYNVYSRAQCNALKTLYTMGALNSTGDHTCI